MDKYGFIRRVLIVTTDLTECCDPRGRIARPAGSAVVIPFVSSSVAVPYNGRFPIPNEPRSVVWERAMSEANEVVFDLEQEAGKIAAACQLPLSKVRPAAQLLSEGNTIPFIARYRKE